MQREPVLIARGLRKAFRGTVAVENVDLTVSAGERVALLGANGAGKTTTLMMLLGAITPDAGTGEDRNRPALTCSLVPAASQRDSAKRDFL